jgi:hypothetical protein
MAGPLKYYDEKSDPPWIKALAEVRRRACHEGWCYHHVQAIIVSIDQYAEAALGNRVLPEPALWHRRYGRRSLAEGMARIMMAKRNRASSMQPPVC